MSFVPTVDPSRSSNPTAARSVGVLSAHGTAGVHRTGGTRRKDQWSLVEGRVGARTLEHSKLKILSIPLSQAAVDRRFSDTHRPGGLHSFRLSSPESISRALRTNILQLRFFCEANMRTHLIPNGTSMSLPRFHPPFLVSLPNSKLGRIVSGKRIGI